MGPLLKQLLIRASLGAQAVRIVQCLVRAPLVLAWFGAGPDRRLVLDGPPVILIRAYLLAACRLGLLRSHDLVRLLWRLVHERCLHGGPLVHFERGCCSVLLVSAVQCASLVKGSPLERKHTVTTCDLTFETWIEHLADVELFGVFVDLLERLERRLILHYL